MQATLEIDDDLLAAARYEAARRQTSIDAAVSMLIRKGLAATPTYDISPVSGLPLLPTPPGGGRPVTMEMVKALIDEEDAKYLT